MGSSAPAGDGQVSRRALLGAGLAATGAIAGGVAAMALTAAPRARVPDPVPAADLVAAAARERALLASYDAALLAAPADLRLVSVRADHLAHLAALTALLPSPARTSATASGTTSGAGRTAGTQQPSAATASPPPVAELARDERTAAAAARSAALAGNGTAAVLLACIAASESSHVAALA